MDAVALQSQLRERIKRVARHLRSVQEVRDEFGERRLCVDGLADGRCDFVARIPVEHAILVGDQGRGNLASRELPESLQGLLRLHGGGGEFFAISLAQFRHVRRSGYGLGGHRIAGHLGRLEEHHIELLRKRPFLFFGRKMIIFIGMGCNIEKTAYIYIVR